jgi:hypothetical protein
VSKVYLLMQDDDDEQTKPIAAFSDASRAKAAASIPWRTHVEEFEVDGDLDKEFVGIWQARVGIEAWAGEVRCVDLTPEWRDPASLPAYLEIRFDPKLDYIDAISRASAKRAVGVAKAVYADYVAQGSPDDFVPKQYPEVE